ncbi:MAG: hypothetical protein PHE25_04895 [Candidatus Gracilibacteria bacterium]|nr:hypothetical protein [Candidatus Gracilibacteria bacterium]
MKTQKTLTFQNLKKVIENFNKNSQLNDFAKYLQTDFAKKYVLFLGGEQITGSLSPFMHTYSAFLQNFPLLYLLKPITKEQLKQNIDNIALTKDILGANITMPFKVEAYNYLNEKYFLDNSAILVGAINTLIKKDEKLIGLNTDLDGIIKPIEEKLDIKNIPKNGYILGAGGASRAVLAGMLKLGITNIIIFNRHYENVENLINYFNSLEVKNILQKDFSINFIKYDVENNEINNISDYIKKPGILVNTLPFGFKDNLPKYPILISEFDKIAKNIVLYFDIVYDLNHKNTPLSEYIKENYKNILICKGIEMLIYQAKTGFENWTAKRFDCEMMKNILMKY